MVSQKGDSVFKALERLNVERMRRSFVKLSRVVESVTNMRTGCLRMAKVAIFVVGYQIGFSKNMENIGLCL